MGGDQMMWLEILSLGLALLVIYIFTNKKKTIKHIDGFKQVPRVNGKLPYFGHGIAFSRDIIGFVKKCYQNYGKIFRIQIYNKDMIVVCDHDMKKEYFKAVEDDMSLYGILDNLYFANAFSDDANNLPTIISMVKKTISIRYDEFVPKIRMEANRMIERLKSKENKEISLTDEMIRFVACTSAQCFISICLSDDFYDILMKFTHLLNTMVVMTYFFPKWLLNVTLNHWLKNYRWQMKKLLDPEIDSYREDPNKQDSLVIRTCVDYDKDGRTLSNSDIGDIIICLLYVSAENTALGLAATVTDLARNPDFWIKVKDESQKYLENDMKSLFASALLDACVMESARMNSHIFALNRQPKNRDATLGEYYVGDADCVAMCEPMMMVYDCAGKIFKDPHIYNPNRFIDNPKEMKDQYSVLSWGAGVHHCPGRIFAIWEIKTAIALITTNFERFKIDPKNTSELNYFSPSAFAERTVKVKIQHLSKTDSLPQEKNIPQIQFRGKTYGVHYLEPGGWLIRDVLSREEQIDFYNYTVGLSEGSVEQKELNETQKTSQPLTYYQLVYTGGSNCSEPIRWFEWANNFWDTLKNEHEKIGFPINDKTINYSANSFYAQLFDANATMKDHTDEHVSWGISISLGSSCDFNFGNKKIILNSGDVLVADFSKVLHGVPTIHDNVPGWFTEEAGTKTFGKNRCSIQIRDISHCNNQKIGTEEFKEFIKTY